MINMNKCFEPDDMMDVWAEHAKPVLKRVIALQACARLPVYPP